jgi:hypothetical protein
MVDKIGVVGTGYFPIILLKGIKTWKISYNRPKMRLAPFRFSTRHNHKDYIYYLEN